MIGVARQQFHGVQNQRQHRLQGLTAPFGLPGRFTMIAAPRVPQTARLNGDIGVRFNPSLRITSGIPGISRSQMASVASGVTSRFATPVPPVVTTSVARSDVRRNAARSAAHHRARSLAHDLEPGFSQDLRHCRAREVLALAAMRTVADGDHCSRLLHGKRLPDLEV